MPLVGSAAVVSIVSRVCFALRGKEPVTLTPAGSPAKLFAAVPDGKE